MTDAPAFALYHGDCLDLLRGLPSNSVQMAFADPPFNVGKRYGTDTANHDRRSDYYAWCERWIAEVYRVLRDDGTFYLMTIDRHLPRMFPLLEQGGVLINLIKWKNVSADHDKRRFWVSTQPILMYGKTDAYKFHPYAQVRPRSQVFVSWTAARASKTKAQLLDTWDDISPIYAGSIIHPEAILKPGTRQKAHPTQMPLDLIKRCMLFSTDAGDLVLDLFSGSGTTGEACIHLDRRFVGFEKQAAYCTLSRARWTRARLQLPLLLEA